MNRYAQTKRDILERKFSKLVKEWKEAGVKGDRKIVVNIYYMLVKAVEEMGGIENNFVWAAFNLEYRREVERIEKIVERFTYK